MNDRAGLRAVEDHVWRYQQGAVHLRGCCVHPDALLDSEPGLDAAWAEAEAALPEGWIISDLVLRSVPGPRAYRAIAQGVTAEGIWPEGLRNVGTGPSPAAALRALAARLAEKP